MAFVTAPTPPPMPQAPGAWWTPFNADPVTPQLQVRNAAERLTLKAIESDPFGADYVVTTEIAESLWVSMGLPEMTEDILEKVLYYFPGTIFPEPDDFPGSEPWSGAKTEAMWYKYFEVMAMPQPSATTPASVQTLAPFIPSTPIIDASDEGDGSNITINDLMLSFDGMDIDDEDFMDVVDFDEDEKHTEVEFYGMVALSLYE